MQCDYFDAGACRSCTLMGTPYGAQLAAKDAAVRATLAAVVPTAAWQWPQDSRPEGFRNKAKLVVGGTRGAVTVGILDGQGYGVDLRRCGILEPGLATATQHLADVLDAVGLTPYDVPHRQGELKYVHLTRSPDGELLARFVLRSEGQLGRLRRSLPLLHDRLVGVRVVTANLHPKHTATLEGPRETVLTEADTLPVRLGGLTLHLPPRAFLQTNTEVAAALYATARDWTTDLGVRRLWDLYCGVGGFALHLARGTGAEVIGVETSADAVGAAERSARELGLPARFVTADAQDWAAGQTREPDLVVINPPRRGIGTTLAARLEASDAPWALYSSCQATTLARDLATMPSLRAVRARLFDMFPQTRHHEVLVLLRRERASAQISRRPAGRPTVE